MNEFHRAWRRISATPALSATSAAVLCVALAVQLTAFATANAIVYSQIDVPDAEQLVSLAVRHAASGRPGLFTAATAEHVATQAGTFTAVSMYSPAVYRLQAADRSLDVIAEAVASTYFDEVGAKPAAGRLLQASDDASGEDVAVLSSTLARRLYRSPAYAIGQLIELDATAATVIGVTEEPFAGIQSDSGADLWLPVRMARRMIGDGGPPRVPLLIARLAAGVTIVQARAAAGAAWAAAARAEGAALPAGAAPLREYEVFVEPLRYGWSPTRPLWEDAVAVLSALATIILVLAIVSVTGVMLTKALAREREAAMELSIGASRRRLLAGGLIESALLLTAAYAMAIPLALWVGWLLTAELSFARPVPIRPLTPDIRVWWWSGAVGVATLGVISMPFSVTTLRLSAAESLTATARVSRRLGWRARAIVATQVMLSLLLVMASGLLLTTWSRLHAPVGGLDNPRVAFARLSRLPGDRRPIPASYWSTLVDALGAIPGVERAALSSTFPAYAGFSGPIALDKFEALGEGGESQGLVEYVTPGFLATVGIPLLTGRDFDSRDSETSPAVGMLTASLAKSLFPRGEAVGQFVAHLQAGYSVQVQVVGVIADASMGTLRGVETNALLRPFSQAGGRAPSPNAFVRIARDVGAVESRYKTAVETSGYHFVRALFTLRGWFANALLRERLLGVASLLLAVLAIALATLGVFVTVAHGVKVRQQEVAIRIALGAGPVQISWLLMRDAGVAVAAGITGGTIASAAAGGLLATQVPGLPSNRPAILVAAIVVVVTAAAVGALAAKGSSSKRSPAELLRSE